ncbi:MAG: hypothetical protein AAGH90_11275 [Pseudomonadota bacterium]
MIKLFWKVLGATVAITLLAATPLAAHEYEEFEPLDPELRSFLVTLLEDASVGGRLAGSPELLSKTERSVSARLNAILDAADQDDTNWLQTAPHSELEHPVLGRVPVGQILQHFSLLAGEIAHAEDHAEDHSESDTDFARDMARLKTLSDQKWGR